MSTHENPCVDGHADATWWLTDGNGIPCAKVCPRCEHYHRAKYRPEVMDRPYTEADVDEPIEPES